MSSLDDSAFPEDRPRRLRRHHVLRHRPHLGRDQPQRGRGAGPAFLAACEACRAESARIERTWNLLGELPETVPGAAYRAVTLGLLEDAVVSRRVVRMMPRKSFYQRPALQAAALALAALGGFAVARSGKFAGQVAANPDPKKTAGC